jgi:hypothetical protein
MTWLGLLAAVCWALSGVPALAQQRVSISGKVLDPDGLALPGATVTVTEQNTGFSRTVVSEGNGSFTVPSLDPGVYLITVDMDGFAALKRPDLALTSGNQVVLELRMTLSGVAEELTVTGQAPLVERTSNVIGGTLSSNEIDDVPANFRNIGALTQLVPGMTPNPAASTFEGGQVVANGTPAQSNVYLVDGMYANDDRLGGGPGMQVRMVLDNIEEYQVLSNQYSAEFGGGAGAIINMVTRGGANTFSGRVYSYFRDERFNARGHFLPDGAAKPDEKTLQAGFSLGGPIVRNRAHFYFTAERDNEDNLGLKRFPAEAAPLARDFVGTFEVRAGNYFGRGDVQLNGANFINARWVLETAPTKGEGFNTSNETADARNYESDWDQLFGVAYTSVLTDRASNVMRFGRIGEQLGSGAQTFFNDDVSYRGFDGRDPFTIGQQNNHPGYVTGKGGSGANTRIRTYIIEDSFSYFVPSLWGGEHTLKLGAGWSQNGAPGRATVSSGAFNFPTDKPYNPADPTTFPDEFEIDVGPPGADFAVDSIDKRYNAFFEDKWRVRDNLTINAGLRYDHQIQVPGSKDDWSPRAGFAWDVLGTGGTVVRGGAGRFYAYIPNSIYLALQTGGVQTLFPTLTITPGSDTCGCVLRPDMIADSEGNLGVAVLSAAGIADLTARRAALLAGSTFARDPRVDSPNRQMPYQNAWSVGVAHQLSDAMALSIDYVGNVSHDQNGIVDINEPVNGVRPGVAVFDPNGTLIPAVARGTAFRRVLQYQSNSAFNGDYKSLQVGLQKRMSNRWSGRLAYTLQQSHYVGTGAPTARRVWLDNEIRADYGFFTSNRKNVFTASAIFNVWRTLNVATVVSAFAGGWINETTGGDRNGDGDRTDRPIAGLDDLVLPIRSELDSQGRAIINGLEGPGSLVVDVSFRYQLPLGGRAATSLDLFFDVFNLANRENLTNPTGNRGSSSFMVSRAAQFARQSQFGVRVRF